MAPRAKLAATRDLPAAGRRLLSAHFVGTFQWGRSAHSCHSSNDISPLETRRCLSHHLAASRVSIALPTSLTWTTLTWCSASLISAPGALSWADASPATMARRLSTPSAVAWAIAIVTASTPTTSPPSPPSVLRQTAPPTHYAYHADTNYTEFWQTAA